MKKKILIATDGSMHAKFAINYAAALMAGRSDYFCTLFNVQPIMSQYLIDEARTDRGVEQSLRKLSEQNRSKSEEILAKGREVLLRRGIDEAQIETISQERVLGLAKDILEYGRRHDFDAVVAGRRGVSRAQKLFMGSVSAKLVEHSEGQALWLVDGDIEPRRLLVAVDVMSEWQRLIDHLSFMLAGMANLQVCFYCVRQDNWIDQLGATSPETYDMASLLTRHEADMIDRFWSEASARMSGAGVSASQLELATPAKTAKIGKMIVSEADKVPYDTVILGRSGSGRAFFFGSVSRYVIDRLTDHALWIL